MTVFSKLWNANVPSESESKSSTNTVATGQFRDGSMTAPNKYWCGATSKLMKGALVIAGVSGASWVVGTAVGSAKANNTAALLLKEASAKASKAPKTGSPKSKAGKAKVRPLSVSANSSGEMVLKVEWSPQCGMTSEQCEKIFCDGLKTVLMDKLPSATDDVELDLTCPNTTRRANCALQVVSDTKFTFSISLYVTCTTTPGDCSDTDQEETAAKAAMLAMRSNLQGITEQQLIDGVKAAISQMSLSDPAGTFFKTFTFTYDQTSAALSDPKIAVLDGSFKFVGIGICENEGAEGDNTPSYIRSATRFYTFKACAAWVNQPLITGCAGFVGIEHSDVTGSCYALYDPQGQGYEPQDICNVPADIDTWEPGSGYGTIVGVRSSFNICYKYVR